MNERDDTVFGERFQSCCPEKVYQLRSSLRQDVKQTDGQIISIKSYGKYTAALPSIENAPELKILFRDKYVDLDMQNDLERAEVLNWCHLTKPLYVIRTTADGNCLLHAISQALWGVEDSDCFLRRLVYANLVTDPNEKFKRRWIFHHRNSEDLQRLDVRLNTRDCCEEWEAVIKATDDLSNSQTHGLPYTALESIHLYVCANLLKRAIIVIADPMARNVFGQTMQDNKLGGIYLPLEWSPEHCHKSPVLIGYSLNHFAPLLFEDGSGSTTSNAEHLVRAIPLVSRSMDSLPVRFMMPNEEANIGNILSDYLYTKNVLHNLVPVPAAKVKPHPIPSTVNIINACAQDCERKFRRLQGEEVAPALALNIRVPSHPTVQAVLKPNFVTKQQVQTLEFGGNRAKCTAIGCEYYASPECGLCTKCFNDYTVQYARQEEAAKRRGDHPPVLQTRTIPAPDVQTGIQPYPPVRQALGNFHDLSMMPEDCKEKCGFKCSSETYPYCHECYPKFNNRPQQPHAPLTKPDVSMLPQNCTTSGCQYKCSRATYPFCHSCFTKHEEATAVAPSAPPPSLPGIATSGLQTVLGGLSASAVGAAMTAVSQPQPLSENFKAAQRTGAHLHVEEPMETQTEAGSLNKKCTSIHCNNKAVRGNNGYCDVCYNETVFGAGQNSPPTQKKCSSPGCEEPSFQDTMQCFSCFLQGTGSQTGHLKSLTGSRPQGMNIVPTQEQKILNSAQTPETPGMGLGSLLHTSIRLTPAEHDERAMQIHVEAPLAVAQQRLEEMRYKHEGLKYICATPGCEGQRVEGSDLCQACLPHPVTPSSSAESLEASCSHSLTKEQMRALNPVVVSSRDKVKCAASSCEKLIYPPKKLCDECSAVLERDKAGKSKQENQLTAGANSPCKTPGCKFFGLAQTNGYCSSCFKSQGTVPTQRYTAPLVSRHNNVQINNTAPLASNIVGPRGEHCLEPKCTRFGDPNQAGRCSEHYEQVIARLPQPLNAYQPNNGAVLLRANSEINQRQNTNVATSELHHTARQQPSGSTTRRTVTEPILSVNRHEREIPEEDAFVNTYEKLFTSKKTGFCKNNESHGCSNYGNSYKQGYCNPCYSKLLATEGVRHNNF